VTAGVTLTPTPWTTIGLGYRSRVNQHVEGEVSRPGFVIPPPPAPTIVPAAIVGAEARLPLPDSVTLSIRQKVTESFTLLATGEWTNWSRFGTIALTTNPAGVPGVPTELPFEWRDGWFASVGAEYQLDPSLIVRTGVGFERSPISDGTRTTRLPDNDRVWVGAGLSYNWSQKLAFDLGYTHIFVKDAPINLVAGHPSFNPALGTFVGMGETQIDIISVGIRYKWGAAATPLVTKG
jgi:long-chain fatty acid transport protein